MNASCDHGAKLASPLTGLIDDFVVAVLVRRLDVREAVESLERMRLVAGSLLSVPCEMGLGGVAAAGAEGVPKRLSSSLWNLRFVVASASGIVRLCWKACERLSSLVVVAANVFVDKSATITCSSLGFGSSSCQQQ